MFLEYLFQPIQNSLYAVLAIHRMVPQIPFALLAAIIVGFITLMTVQGIKFTARTNEVLLGLMLVVTAVFLVQAFRFIVLHQTIAVYFHSSRSTILRLSIFGHWERALLSLPWCLSALMACRSWRKK